MISCTETNLLKIHHEIRCCLCDCSFARARKTTLELYGIKYDPNYEYLVSCGCLESEEKMTIIKIPAEKITGDKMVFERKRFIE